MKLPTSILESAKLLPTTKGNWAVAEAIHHLSDVDARFIPLLIKYGIPDTFTSEKESKSIFQSLFQTIVYQQLAGKAAESIHEKVVKALKGSLDRFISPSDVLDAKFEVVVMDGRKKILINGHVSGLSESKSKYIRSLAEHFNDETKLKGVDFNSLSDDELFNKLISVKGLGPWSIHIFMMFVLQRPNVLPIGDLGVRRGIASFFGLSKAKIDVKALEGLCAPWSPYCTFASFLMWKISDDMTKKK